MGGAIELADHGTPGVHTRLRTGMTPGTTTTKPLEARIVGMATGTVGCGIVPTFGASSMSS